MHTFMNFLYAYGVGFQSSCGARGRCGRSRGWAVLVRRGLVIWQVGRVFREQNSGGALVSWGDAEPVGRFKSVHDVVGLILDANVVDKPAELDVLLLVSHMDGFDLADVEHLQVENVRVAATKWDFVRLGVLELDLFGFSQAAEKP